VTADTKYDEAQSEEEIFAWIFEKVLQSYKNGIKAGQQGTQVIPHGNPSGGRNTPLNTSAIPSNFFSV
jgi:hypothetical protein